MIKPVYEDNHLLVVVKPQGKLTQSDETGDLSLQDECKRYIREKYQKPGEVYLGLVHRLDRPVGGLVAFARTSKSASRLSEQLRVHHMEREYLAVVEGESLPAEGTLCDWLLKDEKTGLVRTVPAGTPGAKEARLRYERLGARDGTALVHLRLETGRKHQIRVQLSHLGYPIRYDMRYGHGERGRDIALFGAVLRLTQKEMTFTACPENPAFRPYEKEITAFLASCQPRV